MTELTFDRLPRATDCVIIGGGIIGAATAFFAARAGLKTVILEKRPALCTLTTPVATGAFRAQFDNEEEIKLVLESIHAFENFAELIGVKDPKIDLKQQGYLWCTTSPEGEQRQKKLVESQRQWGLSDVELLSGDEARRRFPYLSPEVMSARFRQNDGWLNPKSVTMGLAISSRATCCIDTQVTGFEMTGGKLTAIKTNQGTIGCGMAVIAAGPFSGEVARMAGLDLNFDLRIRQKLIMMDVPEVPQNAPMTIDEDTGAHWRPTGQGAYLLYTVHDSPTGPPLENVPTSADFYFNLLRPESTNAVARISPFWRKVWQRNTDLWCLMAGQYIYTPDHRPYLGPTPVEGLFINSGYSGHGIMGSIGGSRLMVDAMTGKISAPQNPFRLDRKMEARMKDVL